MLKINDLCVNYGMLEAVKDVSMEVPEGKVVSLLGANGSGKSTILKTVSGLKAPRQGEIRFEGTKVDGMEIDAIVELGISQVPEGRRLFPYMTVLENLNLGAYVRSSRAEVDKVREEVFRTVSGAEEALAGPRPQHERRRAGAAVGGARADVETEVAVDGRALPGPEPDHGQGDRQDDPVTERERDHHFARRAQRFRSRSEWPITSTSFETAASCSKGAPTRSPPTSSPSGSISRDRSTAAQQSPLSMHDIHSNRGAIK